MHWSPDQVSRCSCCRGTFFIFSGLGFKLRRLTLLPFYFPCFNKTFSFDHLVPLKISVAADSFSYLRVNEVLFNFPSVPTTDKYLGFRCTQLGPKPHQSTLNDYNTSIGLGVAARDWFLFLFLFYFSFRSQALDIGSISSTTEVLQCLII